MAWRLRFQSGTGGLLAGKVAKLRVDPIDSTRIEIKFSVGPDIPIKIDSIAKIAFLGALGAPPGSVLQSREMLAISDFGLLLGRLAPIAEQVLNNLNEPVQGKPVLWVVEALDRNLDRGLNQVFQRLSKYFAANSPNKTTAAWIRQKGRQRSC